MCFRRAVVDEATRGRERECTRHDGERRDVDEHRARNCRKVHRVGRCEHEFLRDRAGCVDLQRAVAERKAARHARAAAGERRRGKCLPECEGRRCRHDRDRGYGLVNRKIQALGTLIVGIIDSCGDRVTTSIGRGHTARAIDGAGTTGVAIGEACNPSRRCCISLRRSIKSKASGRCKSDIAGGNGGLLHRDRASGNSRVEVH